MQTPKAETWIETIESNAAQPVDVAKDWEAHCAWWAAFWDRSWIVASDNTLAAGGPRAASGRALGGRHPRGGGRRGAGGAELQRLPVPDGLPEPRAGPGEVQRRAVHPAIASEGQPDPKRNRPHAVEQPDGTLLTHEDDRLWGRRFTYQNQRLLYWPLLASGDFDLMKPFFDYYCESAADAHGDHQGLVRARRRLFPREHRADGRRTRVQPVGRLPPKTKPGEKYEGWYHDYYFTSGLETTAMMLDYVNYTGDAEFRDRVLVPFAREVLLFFDQHYPRGADGKIRLDPAQVVETWWIAVNPAPDVAGLRFCLDELLAMKAGTAEDQARWRRFRAEIPEVYLQTIEGRQAIAPAEKWEKKHNAENGELYPVFPFRCFGLALGTGDIVAWTMKHRSCKDAFGCACWTQDQIHWAYAGDAAEAADGLVRRFRIASPMCRFPLYGREGPDSCPDFDHFGAGSVALQRMLVQEAGDKILLLPAWPADWDADFKLHLMRRTVLSGTVKDGKLVAWDIQPPSRRKDVVVCQPQPGKPPAPPVPPNDHPLRRLGPERSEPVPRPDRPRDHVSRQAVRAGHSGTGRRRSHQARCGARRSSAAG